MSRIHPAFPARRGRAQAAAIACVATSLLLSACTPTQEPAAMPQPTPDHAETVTVITTGGTIASTHDDQGAVIPSVSGRDLVDASDLPDGLTVEVRELAQLDSSAMALSDTDRILDAVDDAFEGGAGGVVITHGTDSMEETAMAVDAFLPPERRVVLTGAMRPADDPEPDGPGNLRAAVLAAAGLPHPEGWEWDAGEAEEGAFIAFGGELTPARGAYKTHTESTDGFASNMPPRAEGAGAPPTGEERAPLRRAKLSDLDVRIIAAWPGAPRSLIDEAVAAGVDGLVVEGMGSGNVGGTIAEGIVDALRRGVPVVMSTRVPGGPVSGTYGGAGGGATLLSEGAIGSGYLRSPQSRILLAAALAAGADPGDVFASVNPRD